MNTWGDLDNHKNKTIIIFRDGGKGLCKKGKVMIMQVGLNHVRKSSWLYSVVFTSSPLEAQPVLATRSSSTEYYSVTAQV